MLCDLGAQLRSNQLDGHPFAVLPAATRRLRNDRVVTPPPAPLALALPDSVVVARQTGRLPVVTAGQRIGVSAADWVPGCRLLSSVSTTARRQAGASVAPRRAAAPPLGKAYQTPALHHRDVMTGILSDPAPCSHQHVALPHLGCRCATCRCCSNARNCSLFKLRFCSRSKELLTYVLLRLGNWCVQL